MSKVLYTIGQVSKMTGVGEATLRFWEKGHKLLEPGRSNGGFRLFTEDDIAKVRLIKARLAGGSLLQHIGQELLSTSTDTEIPDTTRQDGITAVAGSASSPQDTEATTPFLDEAADSRRKPGFADRGERAVAELSAIRRATAALGSVLDLDQVAQHVLTLARTLFPDSDEIALIYAPGGGHTRNIVKFTADAGHPLEATTFDRAVCALAARESKAITVKCGGDNADLATGLANHSGGDLLIVPLRHRESLLGTVYFDFQQEQGILSLAGAEAAAIFAGLASLALKSTELHERTRLAEEKYRGLVEQTDDLVFSLDRPGRFTFFNPSIDHVLGFAGPELIGKPFLSIVNPQSRVEVAAHFLQIQQSGSTNKLYELSLVKADGSEFSAEVKLMPAKRSGEIVGFHGTIHDITSRKRAEQAVLERNRELATLNEVSQILANATGIDSLLHLAIEKIAQTIGVETALAFLLDEVAGEMVLRSHRGTPVAIVKELSRIRLGTGVAGRVAITGEALHIKSLDEDARFVTKAIRESGFQSRLCVPLKAKDKVVGALEALGSRPRQFSTSEVRMLCEIGLLLGAVLERAKLVEHVVSTQREKARAAQSELSQQAEAQKDERLRLARELDEHVAQPVLSLLQKVNAHNHPESDGPAERDLIARELDRALESIGRALFELRMSPADGLELPRVIREDVIPQFHRSCGTRVQLDLTKWPGNVPDGIAFDLLRLVQESLSNIRRHARAKEARITLSAGKDGLHVCVRDDGVGFNPSVLPANEVGRAGFGLAEVRERVVQLGGSLEVRSSPGLGTEVSVVIPRRWESRSEETGPIRVLAVGDHSLFGQSLIRLVESEGRIKVVAVAESAPQALRMVRQLSPDVVVLDMILQGHSGVELTSLIRSQDPNARIILLTAYAKDRQILEGVRAGALGYISRDYKPQELVRAVMAAYKGDLMMSSKMTRRLQGMVGRLASDGEQGVSADGLTSREIEVLKLLVDGNACKQIAATLGIAEKTVRHHTSSIYGKLHIYDRARLTLYAVRKGLVNVNDGASV